MVSGLLDLTKTYKKEQAMPEDGLQIGYLKTIQIQYIITEQIVNSLTSPSPASSMSSPSESKVSKLQQLDQKQMMKEQMLLVLLMWMQTRMVQVMLTSHLTLETLNSLIPIGIRKKHGVSQKSLRYGSTMEVIGGQSQLAAILGKRLKI